MPITHQPGTALAFQQQFREIGRIKTGQQVEFTRRDGKKGKRPASLETFRLTSPDRAMLERAAGIYGGAVEEWPEAPAGEEFQVVTTTREIDVLVPGGQPLSQWYEMWSGGGCQRRCTGEIETLGGGRCLCPPDPTDRMEMAGKGEACKPTTRVNLLLPDMDLGAWLLVTHSYYAAVELPPVVSLLAGMAGATGRPVPAKLWLDQRRVKRAGEAPKEFPVPALRSPLSWANLLESGGVPGQPLVGRGRMTAQLPAGDTPLPDDPEPPAAPATPSQPAPRRQEPAAEPDPPADPATGEVRAATPRRADPVPDEPPGMFDGAPATEAATKPAGKPESTDWCRDFVAHGRQHIKVAGEWRCNACTPPARRTTAA